MQNEKEKIQVYSLNTLIANVLAPPWIGIVTDAWKLGRKILQGLTHEGIYEVLNYEFVLELLDRAGTRARFQKRKTIRYLQNNIIAYQDYGWGDGQQFLDYRAKPGIPVDRYKIGYKTFILLSLREIKNRGDVDEFLIQWKIKNGFLKPDGFWETDISSRTRHLKMSVIFPRSRPPQSVRVLENNKGLVHVLGSESIQQLPEGKWQSTWEVNDPQLYEHYILRWDW